MRCSFYAAFKSVVRNLVVYYLFLVLPPLDFPFVGSMPLRQHLAKGMMGRIDCPVEANPPASQIIWKKNDRQIDTLKTPRMKVNRYGTLIISKVEDEDEGRYTCTPYSPMGMGRPSTPVQLLVRDPPYYTVRPRYIYQRLPTESVTMPCAAEGDPTPTITWRKADGTFPPKEKTILDSGNLTIHSLSKSDQGIYECVATNLVTTVITTSLLIIESTSSHGPTNVSVEASSHSSKISWLPAYDKGHDQHYILWYRRHTGVQDEWHTIRVIPDDATSITLYKLHPNTLYQFMVLSRNHLGDGEFSRIITEKTKAGTSLCTDEERGSSDGEQGDSDQSRDCDDEGGNGVSQDPLVNSQASVNTDRKPGPPRNVSVLQQKNGLRISWLPPNDATEVPIAHYEIFYKTVGHWVPLHEAIVDHHHYLWSTVSRRAKYYFQVYSVSDEGVKSDPSPPFMYETGDPLQEGMRLSEAVIGGIVAGLLILFAAAVLGVFAVKLFNKRRRQEKELRYGNVKYFGPNHVDNATNKCSSDRGKIVDDTYYGGVESELTPTMDNHTMESNHTNTQAKETSI